MNKILYYILPTFFLITLFNMIDVNENIYLVMQILTILVLSIGIFNIFLSYSLIDNYGLEKIEKIEEKFEYDLEDLNSFTSLLLMFTIFLISFFINTDFNILNVTILVLIILRFLSKALIVFKGILKISKRRIKLRVSKI